MPDSPKTPSRRPAFTLPALICAALAAAMFSWLAMAGTGCGPGLDAVEVTATISTSPTGTPTPGPLSGDVLIAGGINYAGNAVGTAELYDPTSSTFSNTGTMITARAFHTATELANGSILLAGGQNAAATPLNSAEIYNESTEAFRATAGKMVAARTLQTATLLDNGQVLITGGVGSSGAPLASAELYDPSTGKFTATTSNMNYKRAAHTATLLSSGQVLIAGGYSDAGRTVVQNTAELYNPTNQKFTAISNLMKLARFFQNAQIFDTGKLDGEVLLAGGTTDSSIVTATAELYNPTSNAFASVGVMTISRTQFASGIIQIAGSTVALLCGGLTNAGTVTATAELFNPASSTFGPTGNMTDSRRFHTATVFPSGPEAGMMLVTGGQDSTTVASSVNTAELYDPSFSTFSPTTGPMANTRYGHTAVVLP